MLTLLTTAHSERGRPTLNTGSLREPNNVNSLIVLVNSINTVNFSNISMSMTMNFLNMIKMCSKCVCKVVLNHSAVREGCSSRFVKSKIYCQIY